MTLRPLNKHHLEFLRLKGDCKGSSESVHVKMPHCWKHIIFNFKSVNFNCKLVADILLQIWLEISVKDLVTNYSGGSRISGGGVQVCRGGGFALLILSLFFLNIPFSWDI